MNAKKQNKRPNELGSDGGARPLNLPIMKIFEERNWSLDFFGSFLIKQKTNFIIS